MDVRGVVRPADVPIVVLAAALTVGCSLWVYARPSDAPQVVIQGVQGQWVYPLSARETIRVHGPLGTTVVRIEDGSAWVESSPCENQICVAAGHIHQAGTWAVCMPNEVFVAVMQAADGRSEAAYADTLDAASW